jgi:hypothetical protein
MQRENATGDFCEVGTEVGAGVMGVVMTEGVCVRVGTTSVYGVFTGVGRRLKVVDPITFTRSPRTVTIYSSGKKEVVSTSNDQRLYPPEPGTTFTTPDAPEYPLS